MVFYVFDACELKALCEMILGIMKRFIDLIVFLILFTSGFNETKGKDGHFFQNHKQRKMMELLMRIILGL